MRQELRKKRKNNPTGKSEIIDSTPMKKNTILIILLSLMTLALGISLRGFYRSSLKAPLGTVQAGPNEDNPDARYAWMLERLKDPATGQIPKGIRHLEREFAKTLPSDRGSRNLSWLARGPHNIGGRTRALAYDCQNPDHLIAGGVTGAMYASENAGDSWTRVTSNDHFPTVSCIAQDTRPGKTNTWYYGTGELRGGYITSQFYFGDGVYKSTDNGYTWQPLVSTQTNTPQSFDSEWNFVNRVAVDASNDSLDIVYAATYGGIRRSEDGGNTWTEVLGAQSPPTYYSEMAITTTGTVYASLDSDGAEKGIWRSANGIQWVNITPIDTFPPVYERIVIAINPSNENELYFLAKTPGYGAYSQAFFGYEDYNSLWKYTYISGDGSGNGGTWQNLSENLPVNSPFVFDNFYTQSNYNMAIAVSPHNPNLIIIGATNLYRSTDGFTTAHSTTQIGGYWVNSSLPAGSWGSYQNHHPDQHLIVFHPTDTNTVFSANDGGIYKATAIYDSIVVWETMNHGYNTTQVYTVGFDASTTDDVLMAGFQDNANYFVNSADTTAPWTMPLNGDGSYMGIPPGKDYYILSINRGKIYKMDLDNNGQVLGFNRMDPIGVAEDDYLFINPLIMDPKDPDILYVAAGKKLYRNDELSAIPLAGNHDSISQGWFAYSAEVSGTVQISCLDVSENPAHTVWYGTTARKVYKVENADQGDPAHIAMPIIQFPVAYVSRIAVHPQHADTVVVVFSNYQVISLYYTFDGGTTWKSGAGNLEQNANGSGNGPSIGCVDILPRPDGDIFIVGTSVGAFATYHLDGNNTMWTQFGADAFGNSIIEDIKVRELDGLIVIGTYGKGVYSTKVNLAAEIFPEIGIAEPSSALSNFNLYPNPARDYLELQLNGIMPENIRCEVLSLQGKVLLHQELSDHTRLNISSLPSGTYICKIRNGKQAGSKRFVKL